VTTPSSERTTTGREAVRAAGEEVLRAISKRRRRVRAAQGFGVVSVSKLNLRV